MGPGSVWRMRIFFFRISKEILESLPCARKFLESWMENVFQEFISLFPSVLRIRSTIACGLSFTQAHRSDCFGTKTIENLPNFSRANLKGDNWFSSFSLAVRSPCCDWVCFYSRLRTTLSLSAINYRSKGTRWKIKFVIWWSIGLCWRSPGYKLLFLTSPNVSEKRNLFWTGPELKVSENMSIYFNFLQRCSVLAASGVYQERRGWTFFFDGKLNRLLEIFSKSLKLLFCNFFLAARWKTFYLKTASLNLAGRERNYAQKFLNRSHVDFSQHCFATRRKVNIQ